MTALQEDQDTSETEEDYELIPHKEIIELKDEIKKFHENAPNPNKHLQISMDELERKIDNLLEVFERAMHTMGEDEGNITFQEKMQPILHRMDKILEQNAQIADGIVAMADLVNELKEQGSPKKRDIFMDFSAPRGMSSPPSSMPSFPGDFPPPPPLDGPMPALRGMPPPPPRRR